MINARLKTFITVVQAGSFTAAASRLFLSPPAVMKQINQLEQHYSLQLLKRDSKGIHLTPAGEIIYQTALDLQAKGDIALEQARLIQDRQSHILRLGTSLLYPGTIFLDLFAKVKDQFPDIKIEMVPFEDDQFLRVDHLESFSFRYDLIAGPADFETCQPYCNLIQIDSAQHCIAIPLTHPLAQKEQITLDDLQGETIILCKPSLSPTVDQIRKQLSTISNLTMIDAPTFYNFKVFQDCVARNCCMVTLSCWSNIHPALKTIPVQWDWPLPVCLLYGKSPTPLVERILSALQKVTGQEKQQLI